MGHLILTVVSDVENTECLYVDGSKHEDFEYPDQGNTVFAAELASITEAFILQFLHVEGVIDEWPSFLVDVPTIVI